MFSRNSEGDWEVHATLHGGGYNCETNTSSGDGLWNNILPHLSWVHRFTSPDYLLLPVHLYLSPSWTRRFGGFQEGRTKAREVMAKVKEWFMHESLHTKFVLILEDARIFESDIELDDLTTLGLHVRKPRENTVIVYLTGGINVFRPQFGSMCDSDKTRARSITVWHGDTERTAQEVARSIGLTLGMDWDFRASARTGRTRTCGSGDWRDGGFLMSYGWSRPKKEWSTCSIDDFNTYYAGVLVKESQFCLDSY